MSGTYVHRIWEHGPTLYVPPRYRRACGYDAFTPDPIAKLEISISGETLGVISDAEHSIVELNRDAPTVLAPLARLLLRTESIASSKVEGMQVDARTLARAEAAMDGGRSVGRQAAEILANIDAMELAVQRAATADAVHPDDLRDIHRVLLAGDPTTRRPGEFREEQNWIGGNDYNPCGADFVPPPPEEVQRLVIDLCEFCNEDVLPPLIQAAVAHAQFENIHPFADGNGRTGRAFVQVILRRRGLSPNFVPPISVILAARNDRYIQGLTFCRDDRLAEWLNIFASAAAAAAQLASRYRSLVAQLQEEWRQLLRVRSHPRADAAAWALIDVLPAHPIVTIPVAVAATRRTRPAVANALDELEAAGVLVPLSTSQRKRVWEAQGLLDLVVRLEEGD